MCHLCVCICICAGLSMFVHVCACLSCLCVCACCVHVCVCMHLFMCVCVLLCVCMCMYVLLHVRACAYSPLFVAIYHCHHLASVVTIASVYSWRSATVSAVYGSCRSEIPLRCGGVGHLAVLSPPPLVVAVPASFMAVVSVVGGIFIGLVIAFVFNVVR